MCNKLRHYSVGALNFAGSQNYKYLLTDISINTEDELEEGAGIGQTSSAEELVKSKNTISFTTRMPVGAYGGTIQSKRKFLGATVLSLGGTSLLGVVESGSMSVTNTTEDDSAAGDLFECPAPGRVKVDFDLNVKIASVALFNRAMQATATPDTARLIALSMTFPGLTVTAQTVRVMSVNHSVNDDRAQMQNIKCSVYGAFDNTKIACTDPIVTSILTGTSIVAFSVDLDGTPYTATEGALVNKATLNFGNKKLNEISVDLDVRGALV